MDEEDYHIDEHHEWEQNTYQRILNIDDFTFGNLKQMARWGRALALTMFALLLLLSLGLVLLLILAPHFSLIRFLGLIGFGAVSFLSICIFLYPAYELYQFSSLMKTALTYPHQGRFNTALQHLKNMLKYLGILAIVFLFFGIAIFIVWLIL